MSKLLKEVGEHVDNPSTLRKIIFASVNLPNDTPNYWRLVAEFAAHGSKDKALHPSKVQALVENLQYLDKNAFVNDAELMESLLQEERCDGKPLGVVLISPVCRCQTCGADLAVKADRPSHLTLYSDTYGTVTAIHYRKICKNTRKGTCNTVQHYGYYSTATGVIRYDDAWNKLPYFISSQETALEMSILIKLDAEILIGIMSYNQRADIYNYLHGYDGSSPIQEQSHNILKLRDRLKLDRRRLEEAHMIYAVLNVMNFYPSAFTNEDRLLRPAHLNKILCDITPKFYKCFSEVYSAHKCDVKGCSSVLVIDGNLKNHRDICMASEAGFVTFQGLPGKIKTGCLMTPDHKSRYCSLHKPRVCQKPVSDIDNCHNVEEDIAEMIIEEKVTRSTTYYKVVWLGRPKLECSWVPADKVSNDVIEEFKRGYSTKTTLQTTAYNQQLTSTISIENCANECDPPPCQKQKLERHVADTSETLKESDTELKCQTLKEKTIKKNASTTGILAGVWPCGVICILSELFQSESLSHIYGILHEFLHENLTRMNKLDYICYDDGCHLRKYVQNSVRKNLTATAEKLASVSIYVDKMHIRNHTDQWCLQNCDPRKVTELEEVDTEICEQTFSWLSKYAKITRRMNRGHFLFYILYICDLHNRRIIARK